jgi:hypothetical protein
VACTPKGSVEPEAEEPAVTALPACSRSEGDDACIPGPVLAPPLVVGPGRIRALVDGPAAGGSAGRAFRVLEIGEERMTLVGHGSCPADAVPESLGLTALAETAVLCRGVKVGIVIGVIGNKGGKVSWRASLGLAVMSSAWYVVDVPYFAELDARHWAFVYRQSGQNGTAAPPWMVETTPGGSAHTLCRTGTSCNPIAVTVIDGRLHVLFAEGSYSELIVGADGDASTEQPERDAVAIPARVSRPCVAAGRDGSVTVTLPARLDADEPSARRSPERGALMLHYPHALLPAGPDVFPSEVAVCPPAYVDDAEQPAIPAALRRSVRASFGTAWVTAYVATEVSAPSWQQRLLDEKERYSYPGSVRVARYPYVP